ncbi:MAG TPA: hypothetical protein VMT76_15605 [Puia sp.]|nr:hypothetical protein [Puia sp.]
MKSKSIWINLSMAGLCTVGVLGFLLRCKVVFAMPFINYNHLLEAHSHFTFGGWVTLILLTLMTSELLPANLSNRKMYYQVLGGITVSAWCMLITFFAKGYDPLSIISSTLFIIFTYIFGYVFIRDILKSNLPRHVRLLAISSVISLITSSFGTFIIAYVYFNHSLDAMLYRNALFTYLHFTYNGFFSLSIFAIFFNFINTAISDNLRKGIAQFSYVLIISLVPSLFLSYLWQDPNTIFRILAITGSIITSVAFFLIVKISKSLNQLMRAKKSLIRFLFAISIGSFILKLFLQCFTIFPVIGNAIFGNRPIIMGFLHLVFLAFCTFFILGYWVEQNIIDYNRKLTRIALALFSIAVLCNEVLLITQGLITMFIPGSTIFLWLLWVVSIFLFLGTILIAIARYQTIQQRNNH